MRTDLQFQDIIVLNKQMWHDMCNEYNALLWCCRLAMLKWGGA